MTTELAIYNASVPDRMRYAEALSGASLLPDSYRGKPANVLLALEYGAALGIAPMVAIQQVHVIQGRPVASAQLIGALVRKAGHRLRVSGDDRRAVCEIVRVDDPEFTFRSEWTIERATAAKLTSKDTWRQYPANMLRARAITECARDACPEALAGVSYTAEELGDDTLPAEAYPETDAGAVEHRDQGSAAPASPDIEDAVVVEETTGEVVAGEGAASPVNPHAGDRSNGDKVTDAQLRKIGALMRGQSREQALAIVSSVVGRDVESRNDLTKREAMSLISALEQQGAAS